MHLCKINNVTNHISPLRGGVVVPPLLKNSEKGLFSRLSIIPLRKISGVEPPIFAQAKLAQACAQTNTDCAPYRKGLQAN